MPKKLTKEEFLKKANEKHNGKYDYHKVDYVNAHTKACIICPKHGEFWQRPGDHIRGIGCSKCKGEANGERNRLSLSDFIKKANEKHGDKYDYSKVEYVDAHTKICIKCPSHGEFWQTPHTHLQGRGCSTCGVIKIGDKNRLSLSNFIKRANKIHDGKYNYSKVDYVNNNTKICIICPKHGEFKQTPKHHIRGVGCPKCSGCYVPTTEEWIVSANEKHNGKYDYHKVKYVKSTTKVCIICPEHGEFLQKPVSHAQGCGCPKCNLSHLERNVMNYLDEVKIAYDYQKRFKWLGRQSLDFYLPDYKVGIECQGEQHFFPVDFAGKGVELACKNFDHTISCDKRKKTLCEKHGIKLLYFGNVPNYDTFLGEVVHDDVQHLIDYLEAHKKVDE